MNYVKSCVFITMLAGIGYTCDDYGDLNFDEQYNILDLVLLSNRDKW